MKIEIFFLTHFIFIKEFFPNYFDNFMKEKDHQYKNLHN